MNGDFFDFDPSHLLLVLSNYLPEVKEGGESFWRRTRVIEFEHEVPLHERVDELDRKILEADGPGIHGWMVNGAVEVLKNRLRCPQKVLDATKDYRDSEDALTTFVEQQCLLNPHYFTVSGRLFQAWQRFCKDNGVQDSLNKTTFTLKLMREHKVTKGQKKINGKNQRVYYGIELEDDND